MGRCALLTQQEIDSDLCLHTEWDDGQKRVVIVGGGFAGATIARHLERRLPADWDIFLLSKSNVITYNPLLPEVVGASLLPGHAIAPLRHILKRTRTRMVEVNRINLDEQYVEYNWPSADRIRFDHLVLAAGLTARMDVVPGMAEHGVPLKSLGDALFIRNRVIGQLEEATLCYDPERRDHLTNFVVAGGGFSGVEAAGEIQDLLAEASPLFKRVDNKECHVHIVHGRDCLLPEVSESLGRYAERLMTERGVRVHLNARVQEVTADGVVLNSGEKIAASTVINTIGTTPHEFIADLPLADERGRVPVNGHLQAEGYDNVWALGDCAVVPNAYDASTSPTTAQFAVRQADCLARNICRSVRAKPLKTFAYKVQGQLAAIGHRKAVAEVLGFRVSGLIAWFLWRAFYLSRIPTFARKVRLFLEWNWALFFSKDIALMDFKRTQE